MHRPVLVTPPALLPVSLADAKRHLHQDDTDRDLEITALLKAAVAHYDGWTGILGGCLVEQTWRQDFDAFRSCLPLALGPVISVTSVSHADVNGDPATVDAGSYSIKADAGGRSRVEFTASVTVSGAVSVTYKAGYVTTPEVPEQPGPPIVPAVPANSTVPDDIKVAIMIWVQARFDPPSRDYTALLTEAADSIIGKYRRVGV